MPNLTIRMDTEEKQQLIAWAAARGSSVTEYIKALVAADMAQSTPAKRAQAWQRENQAALRAEADSIRSGGIPGAHLALNHPFPDASAPARPDMDPDTGPDAQV